MHALIFATRYVIENKKRKAIRIPLFVGGFLPELKEHFYQDIQEDPELKANCQFLKEKGYDIAYAEYDKDEEKVQITSNYPNLDPTSFTDSHDAQLNYYVRSAINDKNIYHISHPRQREPKAKIGIISGLRYIANKIFGGLLGKIIVKAQTMDFSIEGWSPHSYTHYFLKQNQAILSADRHKVFSKQSVMETIELKLNSQVDADPTNTMYILNVVGYDQCFQQKLNEMKEDLVELNKEMPTRVIGFNFGHVADSEDSKLKTKKDDCVADVMAQVQRLRELGVPAKNVVIKGYSLGAGIGVKAAQHLHSQKDQGETYPVNYFNGRSFDRLSSAVAGWIRTGKKSGVKDRNGFASLFGKIARPFVRFGLWLSKWEINAGKAYLNLPAENKEYIVVRTTDKARKKALQHGLDKHTDDDNTISHAASLHQNRCLVALRKQNPKEKEQAKERKMTVDKERLLNHHKHKKINGHTTSMNAMVNANGETAAHFFRNFVSNINAKNKQEEKREEEKGLEIRQVSRFAL